MIDVVRRVKRIFDSKPIACHIYVTERCNLRCAYCSERDNTVPDPDLATVKRWIDKLKALGCARIGLQGGEPLLHPDVVDIVAHVKSRAMSCSITTNGLLLSERTIHDLEIAGLDALHVSVDRATADEVTKKALELVKPTLDRLARSSLRCHLTSVLYGGSASELVTVQRYASSIGASFKAHLVHGRGNGEIPVNPDDRRALGAFIDWQISEKKAGGNIRTTYSVLAHQTHLLEGGAGRGWTCLAGYKYLFVSARGAFWVCSMRREPGVNILDVTPGLLRAYDREKPCQKDCGVYCVVSESLLNSHPLRFAITEAFGRGPRPSPAKDVQAGS